MQLILFSIRQQWISNFLQKSFDENPLASKLLMLLIYRSKAKELLAHIHPIFCVMVTSPCCIWKVWVSGRHRSTKAVIRPWSISLPEVLRSPSKPSALMMSTTRSTTIGSRLENSSVRLRQVKDPGSYTKRNHGLTYDSKCIYIVRIKCIYIR